MSGIAARSWNSRMEKAARPWRMVSSPFSARFCRANAVDDSASVSPIRTAGAGAMPSAQAAAASTAPVAATCAAPMPKIALRMVHSRFGCSSRPMMNSKRTTPNSAKCSTSLTLKTKPRPPGPMTAPAMR